MRIAFAAAAVLLLSSCGTLGYEDSNAAVDARPECTDSNGSRPGEPLAPWCKREQAATWSSDSDDAPLDLSGKDADD